MSLSTDVTRPASALDGAVVDAATRFTDTVADVDRQARRSARTVASEAEREVVVGAFWDLMDAIDLAEPLLDPEEGPAAREQLRSLISPWMLRSRYWSRALLKPHGYAGDFRMVEWMYDLENVRFDDPTQPAAVTALDACFASVHSVGAVWHRRRWFADLISGEARRVGRPVAVADLACGGSRYVRDVLANTPAAVRLTGIDQDPAAIAFLAGSLGSSPHHRLVCCPVRRAAEALQPDGGNRFDVAISTGLFDYLDAASAAALAEQMTAVVAPGGLVAICNFAPSDRSRSVKDWIVDWQLIYRDADEVVGLFPERFRNRVRTGVSPDGGLVYASLRLPDERDPDERTP